MTAVLIILLAVAAWLILLYVSPFGRCPRCHGAGVIPRGKRRAATCPRCHGRRRVQRPGSRIVHRLARSLRAEATRTRQQRAERARREDTQ